MVFTRKYKICWVEDDKGYGLFATCRIPAGSLIFCEHAAILNTDKLVGIVVGLRKMNMKEHSTREYILCDLRDETQEILMAMQNLKGYTRNDLHQQLALNIHESRSVKEEVDEQESDDVNATDISPDIPMYLYQQAMAMDRSGNEITTNTSLQKNLQQINTFIRGMLTVQPGDGQAWGPYTSLVNHGCNPTVSISCIQLPSLQPLPRSHIGAVAVRALTDIEEDEELTIEYLQCFGTLQQRREQLSQIGISNCTCSTCKDEETLNMKEDHDSKAAILVLNDRNSSLHANVQDILPNFYCSSPATFYKTLHSLSKDLNQNRYRGCMNSKLWNIAINYAKGYNDNIRIFYFASLLEIYHLLAHGRVHVLYQNACQIRELARQGIIWSEENRDLLTLFDHPFAVTDNDFQLMFMLDKPSSFCDYQQLRVTTEGHLAPVTKAENLLRVRRTLRLRQSQQQHQQDSPSETPESLAEASARADRLAAELTAAEDREASKKEKAKLKKKEIAKRSKERARGAKLEQEKCRIDAAAAVEARLAARIAAVKAAVVIPALPRYPSPSFFVATHAATITTTCLAEILTEVGAPSHSPDAHIATSSPSLSPRASTNYQRFRSSSAPEPALIERFLADMPLRSISSAPEDDCISESGVELRYGVDIRTKIKAEGDEAGTNENERKCERRLEYAGWYLNR